MVSMKELAAACNVSIATVSKALNDQHDVSSKTKEKVKRKAREMGYFPNSAAKALKTNRTQNIGVLFVDEAQSGLTHDFFANVLDSFKRTIELKDYDMTMVNCSKSHHQSMSYLDRARYRGFDGVVIACIDFRDPEVIELVDSSIPVVTIDYIFNNRIAVMSDNVGGMRDLVNYVYRMGHRKIAYIHGEDNSVTQARVSSFYTTTEQLGITIPERYVLESKYRDTDRAYDLTIGLLRQEDPPTCIIYPDDFACYGGINAIREMGMSIPDDVSVAAYDGIRISRHIEPKLTTIRQDTEAIGRLAAESLINLIEHPKTTIIRPIIVEGELYKGDSVRDINVHELQ